MKRKGIILAGGYGTRLYPLTSYISKHLLPIYDKPMIYYSLSVLMLTGIREILIISDPNNINLYKKILGDGSNFGIKLQYTIQKSPEGLSQSFILAEDFLNDSPSVLILGDNFFFGDKFVDLLHKANKDILNNTIFGYTVSDPKRYGILNIDSKKKPIKAIEKPSDPPSDIAITGLYFFDKNAPKIAKKLKPSKRGELEITSLINQYISINKLNYFLLGRGFTWLDTGTYDSLLSASNYVKTIQDRQGCLIGSPEEIAYRNSWIDKKIILEKLPANNYSEMLKSKLNLI